MFNTEADTVLGYFKLTTKKQNQLTSELFVGTRIEILDKICTGPQLTLPEKCSLLVAFGSMVTIDEINKIAEAHAQFKNENEEDIRKENKDV